MKGRVLGGIGLALGGILLLLSRKAKAEPPPPPVPGYANLYGIVTDAVTGAPIKGVQATLDSLQANTDANGAYSFTNIEPGDYVVQFNKDGYEPTFF